jgi:hypothetical protein
MFTNKIPKDYYPMERIKDICINILQYFDTNIKVKELICEYLKKIDDSIYLRIDNNKTTKYLGDYWTYIIVLTILKDNDVFDIDICRDICNKI